MENLHNISHGRVISTSELYDNNPETAGRYSGLVSKEEIGEEVNEYDLLYLDTTSESMRKASSGEDGKKQACCMALRNGDSGAVIPVLWLGQVTNKAWSWSKKGVALYLGIEAGGLTENQVGQYIGFAISSTKIHFVPQGVLSTGGSVSAGLKVVTQAATDTLTAAECRGCVISNYGQAAENTQTLPAAAEGLHGRVVIGTAGAGAFHLKAGDGDKIYLDGTELDDGDKASLASPAVGDNFTFFSFQTGATAYDWIVTSGSQGTLRAHFFRFQVVNTQVISGLFSTRAGKSISVDWGDGSSRSTYTGTEQGWRKDYGSAGNRTVRIYGAQNLTKFTMDETGANVQFDLADLPADLAYFLCTGSNTVTGDLADLPEGMTTFRCTGSNTVTGDLADLPADLANFLCTGSNTVTGDLADLPEGMTIFHCTGSNTVTGDLADLPADLAYFRCEGSNTINAYTGKTWTTKPTTLNLQGFSSLDQTAVDNLLVDLDEDLVWAVGNVITITGNCAAPGAAGLAAIASIEGEGATVTVNK